MKIHAQNLRLAIRKRLLESANKNPLSECLIFHLDNGISLDNNVYRPGSEKYFNLFKEARNLYRLGLYEAKPEELELLESDLGEFAVYNGELVPLDFPHILEAKYQGRDVKLGKKGAQRVGKGRARVYVRDKKTGKVKKVEFGSNMPDAMGDSEEAKKRRKSFGKRHNCADKDDNTKPGYWSCRATKLFGRNIPGWW